MIQLFSRFKLIARSEEKKVIYIKCTRFQTQNMSYKGWAHTYKRMEQPRENKSNNNADDYTSHNDDTFFSPENKRGKHTHKRSLFSIVWSLCLLSYFPILLQQCLGKREHYYNILGRLTSLSDTRRKSHYEARKNIYVQEREQKVKKRKQ